MTDQPSSPEIYLHSQPYFVCNQCNQQELPHAQLHMKIVDNSLTETDIPLHCGSAMRLTVLEKELDIAYLIELETIQNSIINTISMVLEQNGKAELADEFEKKYTLALQGYEKAELLRQQRNQLEKIASEIDQQLSSSMIRTGEVVQDAMLRNALDRQASGSTTTQRSGPVLPGSQSNHSLEFFCSVCEQIVEVDAKLKEEILEADEEMELPQHHDQPVQIKIVQHVQEQPKTRVTPPPSGSTFDFFSASNVEEMEITSVGIDIGSSTSHLIFSKLQLRREVGFLNMTGRYNIINRKILFESEIINTPLLNSTTIDVEAVVQFCKDEYQKAGITAEQIDTGAVIVTGETAKKENARDIVERMSDEAGKFVSAVAGPNLESMLGAMGSGAAARSMEKQNTILNVDIGGGTSNLAIVSSGRVVDTSCINVGGRLLGIESDQYDQFNHTIWRIDEPTLWLMKHLGMSYELGDIIEESDIAAIVKAYGDALIEVMKSSATSEVGKQLLMTSDMDFEHYKIDEIMFSGGVAELIYENVEDEKAQNNPNGHYRDIGTRLAQYLRDYDFGTPIVEPSSKIRATVIGTGSYSLSISGSTIFYDQDIKLPQTNIPALPIDARKEDFSKEYVKEQIVKAFEKYDLKEGEEVVALYFDDPIYARDMFVPEFVKAIEEALPQTVGQKQLLILVFRTDVGGTIGRYLKKETAIKDNFLCLDEIELQEGDWVDIGQPLAGDVIPVTVKSLVFN